MGKIDMKFYDYYKITGINPLTEFDDIKVGETYHIPPIILYDRRDFIVEEKNYNYIYGKMIDSNGKTSHASLYRNEVSTRYLIKKQSIKKN